MFMRMSIANNIKSTLPECDSAQALLKTVEERFRSADKSLAGTLMAKLTTMKFDGTCGMHEHILEMTNIAAKLKALGMDVNESFLVQFILNSLPPQFGSFQIHYNTIKDKWNVNELTSMLVQEETRLKQQGYHSVNLVSHGAKKKWKKPRKGMKSGPSKVKSLIMIPRFIRRNKTKIDAIFARNWDTIRRTAINARHGLKRKGFLTTQMQDPNESFIVLGNGVRVL
ncbi:uncharacterized protein LOC120108482 [Phoenix dactylifera]|uniref:Uncharacterized protein LOC120108482 n=1 Tax=Phoenix dactylifera TaxID=42345 RepID=A0A8B8ZUQ0_PHODC|nr:uncharacterized protein LOC120108482 [Phoenix dactylifera]